MKKKTRFIMYGSVLCIENQKAINTVQRLCHLLFRMLCRILVTHTLTHSLTYDNSEI